VKELQLFTENMGINLPRHYTRRNLSFYIQFEATGNPFSPDNLAKDVISRGGAAAQAIKTKSVDTDGDIDPRLLVQSVDEDYGRPKMADTPKPKTGSFYVRKLSLFSSSKSSHECCPISNLILILAPTGPMLATTTLSVLKFVGKYLDMMKTLEHISYEVFEGLTQIVDYYFFAIYTNFALSTQFNHTRPYLTPVPYSNAHNQHLTQLLFIYLLLEPGINPALFLNLKRIQTHLIFEPPAPQATALGLGALTGAQQQPQVAAPALTMNGPSPTSFKIPKAKMPDQLRGNTNFLVIPTLVSAESLLFVQEAVMAVKSVILVHLGASMKLKPAFNLEFLYGIL
jgi:hypothetical protein